MEHNEKRFAFALAALIGLVARGASLQEIKDTLWQYADLAKEDENV